MDLETVEKGQVYTVGEEEQDYFYVAGISEYAVHLVHISQGTVLTSNLCVEKANLEHQSGRLTRKTLYDLNISDKTINRISELETAIENNHPEAVPDEDDF